MWPTIVMRIGGLLLVAVVMAIAGLGCGGADGPQGEAQVSVDRSQIPPPTMLDDGTYVAPKIPPGGYPHLRLGRGNPHEV